MTENGKLALGIGVFAVVTAGFVGFEVKDWLDAPPPGASGGAVGGAVGYKRHEPNPYYRPSPRPASNARAREFTGENMYRRDRFGSL